MFSFFKWSKLKNLRVNIFSFGTYHFYKIGYVFSPLNKELIAYTLQQYNGGSASAEYETTGTNSSAMSRGRPLAELNSVNRQAWLHILLQPSQLVRLVKRYHSVGNGFIVMSLLELISLVYLLIKCVFHQMVTAKNKQLAHYYAANYYPRLFESTPEPHYLYWTLSVLCCYNLIVRLMVTCSLIRKSVVNSNGYKEVEISQLNMACICTFGWKISDWIKVLKVGLKHRDVLRCNYNCKEEAAQDADSLNERRLIKQNHLNCERKSWSATDRNPLEKLLPLLRNGIDFSACYKLHGLELGNALEMSKDWYLPEPNYRFDLWELSWLVYVVLIGTPLLYVSVTVALTIHSTLELRQLTDEPSQATLMECVKQIPNLMINLRHLIRLVDVYIFVLTQLPHHIESALAYLNLLIFVSRVRKVEERCRNDLHFCHHRASLLRMAKADLTDPTDEQQSNLHQPFFTLVADVRAGVEKFYEHQEKLALKSQYNNLSSRERQALNRSLKQNVDMVRLLSKEFTLLRRSLTDYLDVSLIGCGFVCAVCLSALFVAKSGLTLLIVVLSLASSLGPLSLTMILCAAVESHVS